MDDSHFLANLAEEEFGQLHAIHLSENAVGAVQAVLNEQAKWPSLSHCEECGDGIPKERQLAIKGCRKCIFCQELAERP